MKKELFSIFSGMRKKDIYLACLVIFSTGIFIQSLNWDRSETFHGVANEDILIERAYQRITALEKEVKELKELINRGEYTLK